MRISTQLAYQPLTLVRKVVGQAEVALQDVALERGDRGRPEGHVARHDESQQDAQRPDVDGRPTVRLVPEQLRGGVRRRPAERVELLLRACVTSHPM